MGHPTYYSSSPSHHFWEAVKWLAKGMQRSGGDGGCSQTTEVQIRSPTAAWPGDRGAEMHNFNIKLS